MSQKNETKVLLLSLLVTLGLVGGGLWLFKEQIFPQNQSGNNLPTTDNQSISERISFGEKNLIPGEVSPAKKEGVQALADKNYAQAIASLEKSLKQQRNDPQALIYLNNARIGSAKSYTIVASVPLGTDPNSALEILRGIAQAQNALNTSGGINGVPLKVGIANDDDNPQISQQIAANLVKNPDVLGVVGPNASDTTLAAGDIYNTGKLVAISPTSTSVNITNFSPYVFRTVPSDFMAARSLANYMVKNLQKTQAAVFFNSQSNYSQSLKTEFVSSVSLEGGQVLSEFDLSQANFSAAKSLQQATEQGAEVLMFATNSETLDKALQVVQINKKQLNLLGGDDVYNIKTLEVGGEQASGMVLAIPWHIEGESKSEFPQKSRQLWGGDVSWRTAMAYDATVALIAALEKNPTRSGVQQALSSSDFSTTGASGAIRFLPSGDRRTPVQLVTIIRKTDSRSGTGYDFEPIP
ncbi:MULTISPECIES: ABC transporter substrate-binding protein [Cyanophyceae]|uniref:ABC transporter substrate-binding protein n=1 Tax=Cyanophyceae TaxID=3028117 RepID=UPI0023304044|nr:MULTISPECIES: ABC transporter substrate-binding protein [Cyanophyceae]MDB9355190.1 ABC transporter substrate-binding protein [Nodularia spumigena CS-587/03]MDB9340781.1 ABC transporter substrate-binding protein [Nodularia spumigena CS-589/07]MDB9402697.1 ABC transporter substrate-binding protein [Microcystis aeruginosa CS-567/02-A1]MDB9497789.1 ABC transporter substrate-binding protein [Nodularia spumigena CS-336/02]MDB9532019.1 ABC transporter substrate-binding protein [Nodularia spumigena